MLDSHRILESAVLSGLLIVSLMTTALTSPAAANEVLTWNKTALKVSNANK